MFDNNDGDGAFSVAMSSLDDSVFIGDSPSNDIGKSTDTEGVERQLYLEDDSSGAIFSLPLKLRCLLVENAKVEKPEIKG